MERLRGTYRREMDDSIGRREAREFSKTMRDVALIFSAACRVSVPVSLSPVPLSRSCTLVPRDARKAAFRRRRLVRQIAIATASLITGFCVLARRPPRPRPRRTERFAREPTLGTVVTVVHRYCPLTPGRSPAAMSCRTYSLTLDTVPSIQRHFFPEAFARCE